MIYFDYVIFYIIILLIIVQLEALLRPHSSPFQPHLPSQKAHQKAVPPHRATEDPAYRVFKVPPSERPHVFFFQSSLPISSLGTRKISLEHFTNKLGLLL